MSLGWFCPRIAKTFDEGIDGLVYAAVEPSALQPGEVRIAMRACALNFFDLLTLVGRYQLPFQPPFCVTSEGAGVVVESNSSKFGVGDEVCGMMPGTCQQVCVARDDALVRKPKRWSFEQAAATWVGFLTAFHGLVQRGNLRKGEVVLVTGAAGGMGVLAIQVAKERGAIVMATVSSADKVAFCKQAGADAVVVLAADATAWGKQLKDAAAPFNGVDVCYEVVGGELFHACSRVINGGGRLLVVGFAGGDIPALRLNLPLVKGRRAAVRRRVRQCG